MNYNEALEYIHSVSWTFCKPGLERIEELCKRLGNPQKDLKFIHVAGTNGKGSFCSMLNSVLREAGYKTGLFTSPYVKVFNERMAINGEMISNEQLASLTEEIKPIADSMEDKPTEFELITALAFLYFKRNNCDYIVLECGLGGRLDSTNIIESSVLSVITGIALDHTAILGNTVELIAKEKSGIIKNETPVLWCGSDQIAKNVILKEAELKKAPFYRVDRDGVKVMREDLSGTVLDYEEYQGLEISLLGTYQIDNAVNVLNAIEILKANGLEISKEAVYVGMKKAKWHARFELLSKNPLVIFDGGHNPQGVCEAVKSIKKYFKDIKLYVVTGVMSDKDYGFIADKICEIASRAYCITPDNPRALKSEKYAEVFKEKGIFAKAFSSVDEAIKAVVNDALNDGIPVLCLGSLYMYKEISEGLFKVIESSKFAIA